MVENVVEIGAGLGIDARQIEAAFAEAERDSADSPPRMLVRIGIVSTGFNLGGIVSPLLFGWIMDQNMPHWVFGASVALSRTRIVVGGPMVDVAAVDDEAAPAPGMIERGWGRIINMSSIYGLIGAVNRVDYVTSKTALIGMTRAVARLVGAVTPFGLQFDSLADIISFGMAPAIAAAAYWSWRVERRRSASSCSWSTTAGSTGS